MYKIKEKLIFFHIFGGKNKSKKNKKNIPQKKWKKKKNFYF